MFVQWPHTWIGGYRVQLKTSELSHKKETTKKKQKKELVEKPQTFLFYFRYTFPTMPRSRVALPTLTIFTSSPGHLFYDTGPTKPNKSVCGETSNEWCTSGPSGGGAFRLIFYRESLTFVFWFCWVFEEINSQNKTGEMEIVTHFWMALKRRNKLFSPRRE